jgi:predicted anti-sigma-YlaC factor YlaD
MDCQAAREAHLERMLGRTGPDAALDEHLARCPACRAAVAEEVHLDAWFEALRTDAAERTVDVTARVMAALPATPPRRRRARIVAASVAAAAALLFVAAFVATAGWYEALASGRELLVLLLDAVGTIGAALAPYAFALGALLTPVLVVLTVAGAVAAVTTTLVVIARDLAGTRQLAPSER